MKHLNQIIKPASNPTTETDVSAFEEKHGLKLPRQYRDFLLKTNGGKPENTYSESPDDRTAPIIKGALIDSFLGLGRDGHDLDECIDVYTGRLPKHFIPIAGDQGGDLVILATGGKHEGKVYVWEHEEEYDIGFAKPDDASDYYENVYLLGSGFNEFFESLQPQSVLDDQKYDSSDVIPDEFYLGLVQKDLRLLSDAEAAGSKEDTAKYMLMVSKDYVPLGEFDEAERYYRCGMEIFANLGQSPQPDNRRWEIYLNSLVTAREERSKGNPDWYAHHLERTYVPKSDRK